MTTDEGTFSIRANYDKLKQDAESEAVSSEDGTDKVRESYWNHDRTGRSGLRANLDVERQGHGDDRARHQPGAIVPSITAPTSKEA
jgi:hypothetical protein